MAPQIVFFDDYPLEKENQLFMGLLRRRLRGDNVELVEEKIVQRLETLLRTRTFIAIVLDVIAAMPHDRSDVPSGDSVGYAGEGWTGIEILRRCRSGQYGKLNQTAPIFMRTARGEIHVRAAALRSGCTDYFMAGSEDDKLIDVIAKLVGVP
jgi:CheY-like chemotaxis protein